MGENKQGSGASGNESLSEQDAAEKERRPRISYIVAGICALLVAGAAGAAIVADKAYDKENSTRIYSSSSVSGGGDDSSVAGSDASEDSDSSGGKKTKTTTTAAVYEYPQDINKAEKECFLAVSGINKTAAEGIIAFRERRGAIHNYEELLEIYGVGEGTLSVIEEHFFVSDEDKIAYTTASKTTRSRKTTEKETTASSSVTSVPASGKLTEVTEGSSEAEPPAKEMRSVNINKADAETISRCLLLDIEQAQAIVELRSTIGRFSDMRELLLNGVLSKAMLAERKDYILLEDGSDG